MTMYNMFMCVLLECGNAITFNFCLFSVAGIPELVDKLRIYNNHWFINPHSFALPAIYDMTHIGTVILFILLWSHEEVKACCTAWICGYMWMQGACMYLYVLWACMWYDMIQECTAVFIMVLIIVYSWHDGICMCVHVVVYISVCVS